MRSRATVQSPAGYDRQHLTGPHLGTRLAAAASAQMRADLRTALQDGAYLFRLHPSEDAAGLTEADVNFGFELGNVLRYATDPEAMRTGAEDCFDAVQICGLVAMTGEDSSGIGDHGRIYFPRGNYVTEETGLFNFTASLKRGFIIEGDGLASSQILLVCDGQIKYFYENDTALTQQAIFVTVRDLKFVTDDNAFGRFAEWYQEQGWRFFRCWFRQFRIVIQGNGTVNGSEHKFYSCKFTEISFAIFRLNGNQILNIEFFGCDGENITGHCFRVEAGGGGALRVYGGSWIMDDAVDNAAPAGGDHYFLSIDGGELGNNNNTYLFSGLQFELHATSTKLVTQGAGSGGAHVLFDGCNVTATNGARRTVLVTTARVTFRHCVLTQNQGDTYEVIGPVAAGDQYGEPGSLQFVESDVPLGLSSFITLTADGNGHVWGSASARGCYNNAYGPGLARTERYAMDFDMNWANGGRSSNVAGLKRISVKPQNRQWPFTDNAFDWRVNLPVGALIKNIYVLRPPGASGSTYTLRVGNGDMSVEYGNSGALGSNVEQSVTVERTLSTLINAGSSAPGNQVRVWASPTLAENVFGGYFIVEYF